MLGPLNNPPFSKIHFCSPSSSRQTRWWGSCYCRLLGQGISSCINSNYHDNMEFTLKYPTIDHLGQQITCLVPETVLFKIDLESTSLEI